MYIHLAPTVGLFAVPAAPHYKAAHPARNQAARSRGPFFVCCIKTIAGYALKSTFQGVLYLKPIEK
jgi:hypothetical protein